MRTALPSSGGYPAVQRRRGREAPIYRACRRFCRNKLAVAGLVIVLLVIVAAVLAPYISPHDPLHQDLMEEDAGLSWQHWLGADQLGRDILSRLIYGARVALVVGGLAVSASVVVGLFIGIPSAYLGGWLDDVVMRIMDVLLAFPYLLLAIAIVAALGPGLYNTIIAIAVWLIPTYARLSRSVVLSTKQSLYVEAARAIGSSAPAIMWRHLLPSCLTPILVQVTLDFGRAILMEAGLSYLGYGIQPPAPSWGSMIAAGQNDLLLAPHIAMFPGVAIVVTVLSLNLIGDGLRDALDWRGR